MRYAFNDYLLDPAVRELRCRGGLLPVEPQVFDLLLHLLRHRERVVSTDELVETVWAGRYVSESTIRSRINAVRRLVGDDGERQAVIRTLPRRGLRFVAAVEVCEEGAPLEPAAPAGAEADPPAAERGAKEVVGEVAEELSGEVPPPEGRRRPVVAVLPFTNLSGDPLQDHLGDGVTEDIITLLARHRSLVVVARNSAFAFRQRAGDLREAGAKLGADYVVEGSVRRSDDNLRVTAHLIRTDSGRLLWSERFDRRMAALFELQDAITTSIVAAIEPQIGSVERARVERKRPTSLRAWDLLQLGTAHLYRATRQDNREAERLLRLATESDEALAQAHAHLSYAILLSMLYFEAEPEEARLAEAQAHARRALELDEQDAMIRFVYGRVLLARCDYGDALEALEQAVELNPALAIGYCGLGDSLAYEGRFAEAFPHFQRAIELSPHDPQRWAFHAYRALAHLFARQFRLAADWAKKATHIPNCHYWPYAHRVAALGHLRSLEELRPAVAALLERRPDFTCRMARKRLFYVKDPNQIALYLEGLAKAGIDE